MNNNDFKLTVVLILVALILFFSRGLFFGSSKNLNVTVNVDGKKTAELPLNKNTSYIISGFDGGQNTLYIENGTAFIKEASCPDKICERKGKISREGEMIVCLPNRVVVSITK